ncbi:MAG TPA: transposase [Streptosporangiaceae bacterium]|nr:transposase [Streptosporangiaceae bacterium]
MQVTGWSRGLEVSGGGQGVVSHAGLALLRHLADRTGLSGGLSRALASPRLLVHDRGRVLADLACAIADGARVISDFRVMRDQAELFGLVASVPTAWRTLKEIARAGTRAEVRITQAVNAARRHAWAQAAARHGALPGVRLADRTLDGVTCIRLDATVTFAHSDKELAEANFKGFGHHPLLAVCDNTGGEPLAWMLRPGSAGSNTAADHTAIVDAAIAALPPAFRRKLMITCVIRGRRRASATAGDGPTLSVPPSVADGLSRGPSATQTADGGADLAAISRRCRFCPSRHGRVRYRATWAMSNFFDLNPG